jgi:hypothetical protein
MFSNKTQFKHLCLDLVVNGFGPEFRYFFYYATDKTDRYNKKSPYM